MRIDRLDDLVPTCARSRTHRSTWSSPNSTGTAFAIEEARP
jgi:hypothetical protein